MRVKPWPPAFTHTQITQITHTHTHTHSLTRAVVSCNASSDCDAYKASRASMVPRAVHHCGSGGGGGHSNEACLPAHLPASFSLARSITSPGRSIRRAVERVIGLRVIGLQ